MQVTIAKNKNNEFVNARLEINGNILVLEYSEFDDLVRCINNPVFVDCKGRHYYSDLDYINNKEKKNSV